MQVNADAEIKLLVNIRWGEYSIYILVSYFLQSESTIPAKYGSL